MMLRWIERRVLVWNLTAGLVLRIRLRNVTGLADLARRDTARLRSMQACVATSQMERELLALLVQLLLQSLKSRF